MAISSSAFPHSRQLWTIVLVLGLIPFATTNVRANPSGGVVQAGAADIVTQPGNVTINQDSARAIIDWSSFSIANGEVTTFNQPAGGATLNRVTGLMPSALDGLLNANGSVYLLNPNGVVLGPTGQVVAGSFVASTLDTPNADFMGGGNLTFSGNSLAGISVAGSIVTTGGDVVLIGQRVEQSGGAISAAGSTVALAAGQNVLFMPSGSERVLVQGGAGDGTGNGVQTAGVIEAAQIELEAQGGNAYALAINHTGLLSATGTATTPEGRVRLTSAGGAISVDRAGPGDSIVVSGAAGGSASLQIGGASHDDPDKASSVTLGQNSTLRTTSAGMTANTINIHSAESRVRSNIEASGNAVQADVSGNQLTFFAQVDLDTGDQGGPSSFTLRADSLDIGSSALGADAETEAVGFIRADQVNVITTNDLTVSSTLNILGSRTDDFSLSAGRDLILNANVALEADGGHLKLSAGRDLSIGGSVNNGVPGANLLGMAGRDILLTGNAGIFSNNTAVLVAGQRFLNTATLGAQVFVLSGSGRYLIYAANPATSVLAGLDPTKRYNRTFAADPPSTFTANESFIAYAIAPVLNFTATSQQRSFGQDNPTLAFQLSGLIDGDLPEEAFTGSPVLSTIADLLSPVGNYPILVDVSGITASELGYQIQGINGNLAVVALDVFVNVRPNDASRFFGDPNPTFTATFDGFPAGFSQASIVGLAFGTTATITSPVGQYPINLIGGFNPNFNLVQTEPGVLTINPAPLVVRAEDATRLFGAANPAFTASFSGLRLNDTPSIVSNLSFSTSATPGSNVGGYAIIPTGSVGPNYQLILEPGTLSVTPAPLQVFAEFIQRPYGSPNPALTATATGLVAGNTLADLPGLTLSTTATQASNVGNYLISVGGAVNPNYTIQYLDNTLQVVRAPLTIMANSATRLFGAQNPAFSASFAGLVNGDSPSVVNALVFNTPATPNSNVGSYAITPSGGFASNYQISYGPAALLTVTPAPLTVTASSFERVYGDPNPVLTASFSGLVAGNSPSLFGPLDINTVATPAADVGRYAVRVTPFSAPNYAITFVDGVANVIRRDATILVNDFTVSRTDFRYARNTFEGTYGGFIVTGLRSFVENGITRFESPESAFGSIAIRPTFEPFLSSAQSEWELSVVLGGQLRNYNVTFVPGTLTLTGAPIPFVLNFSHPPLVAPPTRPQLSLQQRLGLGTVVPDSVLVAAVRQWGGLFSGSENMTDAEILARLQAGIDDVELRQQMMEIVAWYATYLLNKREGGTYMSSSTGGTVDLPPRALTPAETALVDLLEVRAQQIRAQMLLHMLDQMSRYQAQGTGYTGLSSLIWKPTLAGFQEFYTPPSTLDSIAAGEFTGNWPEMVDILRDVQYDLFEGPLAGGGVLTSNTYDKDGNNIGESDGAAGYTGVIAVASMALNVLISASVDVSTWMNYENAVKDALKAAQASPSLSDYLGTQGSVGVQALFMLALGDPPQVWTPPPPENYIQTCIAGVCI